MNLTLWGRSGCWWLLRGRKGLKFKADRWVKTMATSSHSVPEPHVGVRGDDLSRWHGRKAILSEEGVRPQVCTSTCVTNGPVPRRDVSG